MPRKIKTIDPEKFKYELCYINKSYICGTDEVGRGPLAGPVCVASVMFPTEIFIAGSEGRLDEYDPLLNKVNDSKKLSAAVREELFDVIKKFALSYNIQFQDRKTIDEINILNATKNAMKAAICSLEPFPAIALVDAVKLDLPDIEEIPIIKGDALSFSIAAASILAKVSRDRLMDQYDAVYPEYGFIRHKGYGTAEHIAAIKKYGLTPIHRRSFCKNFTNEQ